MNPFIEALRKFFLSLKKKETHLLCNEAGLTLIKDFEDGGWRDKKIFHAYVDEVGNGKPVTIGYGYTNQAGFGPGVKMGDVWTKAEAEHWLEVGVQRDAKEILKLTTIEPTSDQLAAMCSFVWNLGIGNFRGSTFLKRHNAGDFAGAAEALTWWNKAQGRVLKGLVRRREAEKALYLKGS